MEKFSDDSIWEQFPNRDPFVNDLFQYAKRLIITNPENIFTKDEGPYVARWIQLVEQPDNEQTSFIAIEQREDKPLSQKNFWSSVLPKIQKTVYNSNGGCEIYEYNYDESGVVVYEQKRKKFWRSEPWVKRDEKPQHAEMLQLITDIKNWSVETVPPKSPMDKFREFFRWVLEVV